MSDFKGRHFGGEIVLWAVRWYCRYGISYRDLEQMMAERGVWVDHSTIYRWVQKYAPEIEKRLRWHRRRPRSGAGGVALHDYRHLGAGFRERERIKRKKQRWTARLHRLPVLERQALLAAIDDAWRTGSPEMTMPPVAIAIFADARAGIAGTDEGGSSIATNSEGGRHRHF